MFTQETENYLASQKDKRYELTERGAQFLRAMAVNDYYGWKWQHADIDLRKQLERAGYCQPAAAFNYRLTNAGLDALIMYTVTRKPVDDFAQASENLASLVKKHTSDTERSNWIDLDPPF